MNFKKLAVAAAAAGVCLGASAENVNVTDISLESGTAYFGAMHFENGDFRDMFSFVKAPALSMVSASLITIDLGARNIRFEKAELNGEKLTLIENGMFQTGTGSWASLAGPYTLEVWGATMGVGKGIAHSYSGTMNVTAVPEPETYALMLAGLGAVAFMARRRKA